LLKRDVSLINKGLDLPKLFHSVKTCFIIWCFVEC